MKCEIHNIPMIAVIDPLTREIVWQCMLCETETDLQLDALFSPDDDIEEITAVDFEESEQ